MQIELKPFDVICELVQNKWFDKMSRFEITVEWNHEADESNGVYLSIDSQIHHKPDNIEHIYIDLSKFDVHDSQQANDIIRSIMLIVEQGDNLSKWSLTNEYTNCMIGSHGDIFFAQILRKVSNEVQVHDSHFDPPTYIKYQ
ncbi:unnamed protein product [Rotaria sp. Silwood2]|nr:unnamed protein product [Rotaria sp. Silwood2]CAF3422319.1 unnamed protein product [Rotaria sp. Silwood2]CAF4547263.1 unnamed protein product [Rotaria sp. Silwood2]CAF4576177.1 unnamed protein product [Rotaria sp. Silwood2]